MGERETKMLKFMSKFNDNKKETMMLKFTSKFNDNKKVCFLIPLFFCLFFFFSCVLDTISSTISD